MEIGGEMGLRVRPARSIRQRITAVRFRGPIGESKTEDSKSSREREAQASSEAGGECDYRKEAVLGTDEG